MILCIRRSKFEIVSSNSNRIEVRIGISAQIGWINFIDSDQSVTQFGLLNFCKRNIVRNDRIQFLQMTVIPKIILDNRIFGK